MVLLAVDGVVLPRAVKYPVLMNCRQAPSKGEPLHCVVSYLAGAKFALRCQLPCYSEMWLCVVIVALHGVVMIVWCCLPLMV